MATLSRCVRLLLLSLLILPHAAAEAADVLFPPDAVINVKDYGALPDDQKDDTQAIQKAITDHVGTGRTIYFPAGTYDLSDTLRYKDKAGKWEAHLTLQGAGRDRTILCLPNRAPGFADPASPRAMIMTGSHWNEGDALEPGGGNKAFRNNIRDLTLLTSLGNPGAVAIEWAVSNQGTIHEVGIRSGDGAGVAGIAMRRQIPGPGLIKNSVIHGFDMAIDVGDIQYGVTVAGVMLRNQKIAAIRVSDNLVHLSRVTSVNRMPAVLITGRNGVATAISCDFPGIAGNAPAIESSGNALLARGINTEGDFRIAGQTLANTTDPRNYDFPFDRSRIGWPVNVGGKSVALEGPVVEAWHFPAGFMSKDLSQWQPVGPRLPGETDDTAAIQRAIDAGKPVVYFPIRKDAYFLGDTVTIRGKVRHVLGMGQEISLGAAEKPFSNRENPRPLFRIDPVDGDDVTIENCFFNAQYPGEVIFENNSPKTLVIRHCLGWVGSGKYRRSYQNTPASFGGKVFIEDCFLPGWRFEKQDVWARQFNPENMDGDGQIPQVANIGGKLWILGFKTEGPAPFIHTSAGGITELLGAYNYISATAAPRVPEDAVPYIVEDSSASLTFATDNFRPDSDYKVYIRNIENGKVIQDVKREDLPPRNGQQGDRSFVVTNLRIP